jgi:XTP/dITP diphosphohydrolase
MTRTVLVATHNRGKIAEYKDLLQELALDWVGLADVGVTRDVAETGNTFEANAILKAAAYAAETKLLTLADDSGLEVDALNGEPGVLTARYGGEGLTPKERYELLLRNLAGVSWEARTARFRCVIAVYDQSGLVGTAEGSCEGIIATEAAGEGGFGYDPVFYLPDWGKTMAQLPPGEKHKISHRGKAVAAIEPLLRTLKATSSS